MIIPVKKTVLQPSTRSYSIDLIKEHLRRDDIESEELLLLYCKSAHELMEKEIRRHIGSTTTRYDFKSFDPNYSAVHGSNIPTTSTGSMLSVSYNPFKRFDEYSALALDTIDYFSTVSFTYINPNAITTTLPTTSLIFEQTDDYVAIFNTNSWPQTLQNTPMNTVSVTITEGLPWTNDLELCHLQLVASLYENRGDASMVTTSGTPILYPIIPAAATYCFNKYKPYNRVRLLP